MRLDLNGLWKLSGNKFNNVDANVPGTVLSNLLEQKLIVDPFKGKNEFEITELLRSDFTFTKEFPLLEADLKRTNYLCLDGIDTICDVYINDHKVCSVNDMHIKYRFKLDNGILSLNNTIRLEFKSALNYVDNYKPEYDFLALCESYPRGNALRKCNSMFGWDWGPNLPDMGIFRSIYIDSTDVGYLESFRHHVKFNEDYSISYVDIDLRVESLKEIKAIVTLGNGTLEAIDNKVHFEIENPKLWNPVGYGEANLYDLHIRLTDGVEVQDYDYQIGLREVVIDDSYDEYGRKFELIVNGKKIYLKGSDFIPQDNILPRVNEENTLRMLNLAKDFNQNVIRVWGGGYYLDDYFYSLCDKLGILVFQDLMFACGCYDMDDSEFVSLIKEETTNVLKRIRHHASIYMICGSNENEMVVTSWLKRDNTKEKKDFVKQYIEFLKPIVETESDFYYLLSSPTADGKLFVEPNTEDSFDMHYWDVWHGYKPFSDYKTIKPRLLSEFGCQSFPIYDTVLSYVNDESDLDLLSPVMMHHQKNRTCNDKILGYIKSLYKDPKDFKNLVYLSQMSQAEGIKTCVEHLRRIRGINFGVMYWQLNDCWPGQSWSSLDCYYNPKALHYYSKKFYNNYLVSIDDKDNFLDIHISNDDLSTVKFKLCVEVIDFNGHVIKRISEDVNVLGGTSMLAISLKDDNVNYQTSFVLASLYVNGLKVSENSFSRLAPKDLDLANPNISINKIDDYSFTVSTDKYALGVYIEPHDNSVLLSDNYFNLVPGRDLVIKSNNKLDFKKLEIMSIGGSY